MNNGKLYLNMILKDSESAEMVKRAIDSVKDQVDGIYITVTYSDKKPETSDLVKLLHSYKADVSFYKWNYSFGDARNFAMSKVPTGEKNYIFWIDADDVLIGAEHIRVLFQDAVNLQHAAVFIEYWYAVDLNEKGEVREILIKHKRERLIRNDGTFKWVGDLHELLIEQRQENVQKVLREDVADKCYVMHLTSRERCTTNLERNIHILETAAEKQQHRDPRTLVYLGKGYYDKAIEAQDTKSRDKWLDKALTLFTEYLQGSGQIATKEYREGSGWREERANTWQFVAESFRIKGDLDQALIANQRAIDEAPEFPMYHIERSLLYCQQEDYKKARIWLQLATALTEPKTTIITTPRDMKLKALEANMRIALAEGRLEKARQSLELMLEMLPDNKDLQQKLLHVVSVESANKAAQSVVFLGKYLEQLKQSDLIVPLLQSVPHELRTEKFYSEMAHKFIPPKTWESNEITILCGPGFEQWSPKSIDKGIGGSEEAVIYLSQELTNLGWKVTVYANPMQDTGDHNGVTYKQWYDLNIHDSFNVLILWRAIGMADFDLKSRFTMLWMHDIPQNTEMLEKRIDKINKIAVLSQYHKSLFRMSKNGNFETIPDDKFFLTSNGIPEISTDKWNGDPHRMCYISSLDRGLEYLLVNWKDVRRKVPDASLHVYYGAKLYEFFYKDNPSKMAWLKEIMRLMKQPGIHYHGRVSHTELHEEMNKCGIWAYPTAFEEISCISAMKAQRLGAIPVVTDYAALKETVKNGLKVNVDITSEEGQQLYTDALIEILRDTKKQGELRPSMMYFAKHNFGWKKIAKQWNELFKPTIETPAFLLEKAIRDMDENQRINSLLSTN